jgi:hypothetical protein
VLGVAVSVTVLPEVKVAEHAEPPEPQLIPVEVELTVPLDGLGLIERV